MKHLLSAPILKITAVSSLALAMVAIGGCSAASSGSGASVVPTLSFSSTTLAFGATLVFASPPLSLTVTNTSTAAATFNSATVTGTNASQFSIASNTCTGILAAKAACTLTVTFKPTAVTTYSASISLADNAQSSPQTVALTGNGITEPKSCSGTSTTSPSQKSATANYPGTAFSGQVMAGLTPVIGASVQIYAAGQAGNGSTPTTLLKTPLITNSSGAFAVPASFTCPYSNSVLYAVASGGHTGLNAVNAGIVLATVIGTCNSITGSPIFTIDEATTATMVWSMQQFMAPGGKMGATATNSAGSTNSAGIVLAANTFSNLVNPLSGTAPGTYFPSTGSAPVAKINQLANLLNTCTVSVGMSSSNCTQLYALTATSAGTPGNTLDAALNLVRNPGNNTATLYTLSTTSTAYSPTLTAAPADWTLYVTYSGGAMKDPSALAIDSTGIVWVANYFNITSAFTNTGVPLSATGYVDADLNATYGGAVNVNDHFWVTNEEGGPTGVGTVVAFSTSGSLGAFAAPYVDFPLAVAFDPSGIGWVVDYGNSSVALFLPTYYTISGPNGFQSSHLVFPVAIATDADCNAYVANQSSNTVTFVAADGSSFTDFVVGSSTGGVGPSGVAVDASGNVWSANYYGNSVGLIAGGTTVASGNGFTGGGLDHPQGIAADGAGNIWVANYRGQGITELAGGSATNVGAPLSPSSGWAADAGLLEPFALAIDAGGSVWVSNFATNTITEFIGVAAPVQTPLIGPVRVP